MSKKMLVAILPLNSVSQTELNFAEKTLREQFNVDVRIMDECPLPSSYFDRGRGQWDADRLLELLFDMLPNDCSRIVGVLASDMFAAGRTFVFGYAHLRDGVAVYSTARLQEEWYGRAGDLKLQQSRSFRCIVHEVGHTFGNPHCEGRCVMHSVCHVDSLDALEPTYCDACARRVKLGVKVLPDTAEGYFLRAGALLRRRYLPRSIEMYRKAAEKAPLEPRYHNDLGVALLSAADREGARKAFARATELSATFPHPYYNLGILCREDGGVQVAETWFNKGLQLDLDQLAAHRYLGRLYEDLFNDTTRAFEHYQAYKKLGGMEGDVIDRYYALMPVRKKEDASASIQASAAGNEGGFKQKYPNLVSLPKVMNDPERDKETIEEAIERLNRDKPHLVRNEKR